MAAEDQRFGRVWGVLRSCWSMLIDSSVVDPCVPLPLDAQDADCLTFSKLNPITSTTEN